MFAWDRAIDELRESIEIKAMLSPLTFLIAFLFANALLVLGAFFVRNPGKMYRWFSFGQAPTEFGVRFFRFVGWFYVGGAVLGVLMLAVAAFLNFFHSH